jgi:hypothetical protein
MIFLFLILVLVLLGPLAYFWGADSRVVDPRDRRGWL